MMDAVGLDAGERVQVMSIVGRAKAGASVNPSGYSRRAVDVARELGVI